MGENSDINRRLNDHEGRIIRVETKQDHQQKEIDENISFRTKVTWTIISVVIVGLVAYAKIGWGVIL